MMSEDKPEPIRNFLLGSLFVMLFCLGCESTDRAESRQSGVLRLAVTTSTRDSGLLDQLVPVFEKDHGVRVDVIAVGTGKALKLGEAGDVDVLLVHARKAEDAFMSAGFGSRREDVMYNTFLIVGPASDPAQVRGMEAAAALQHILTTGQPFVSRGDESGTHQRELTLWEAGGGKAVWEQYVESGQGMGASLIMADQMQAYILTDKATYLRFKSKTELMPVVTSSQGLRNPYGIIVVKTGLPSIAGNVTRANAFVDFLISESGQKRIRDYMLEGERLFYPLHLPLNAS